MRRTLVRQPAVLAVLGPIALGALGALGLGACRAHEPAGDAGTAPTASTVVEARPWEHESSDIPVDPRIRFGALDSGLRWAYAVGREPRERSYLRLHVDVGSLAEEEHERGMAHFLEHMAFNGSVNFEPGTLVEWFQEHGMAFGADTNAHTSFGETVYKLDLPQSDAETLREGLLVLRDFADGLLLEPDEVEAEKGVIDGEERESDSAARRVFQRTLEELFDGTRYPERLPIGTKEARAAFTAETVDAFYRRWYRPQNMTLVLVGDLGDLDPVPLFEEAFGDMAPGDAVIAEEPDPGEVAEHDAFFAVPEDEIPVVQISVQKLRDWEDEPVTVAEWLEDLPLQYARAMLNLRFRELAKDQDAPFLNAGASSADALEVLSGEALEIVASPESWREALVFCARELRRALEFGFQDAELLEVRADALRALDEAVEREGTQHSAALVRAILAAAESPYVPTSAATDRDVLRPAIEALDVEACHAAFALAWDRGELSIVASGDLEPPADPEAAFRGAWEEAWSGELDAGAAIETQTFAYASSPDVCGEVVERRTIDDLGFEALRFANGVALNVKRTDFKEKEVLVSVRFGEGRLSLAPEDAAVEWVAARIFDGFGLGAHAPDDLRRLTAGRTVGASFSIGVDAFELNGATTAEDLLFQCELLAAHFTDPGWRDEGWIELARQVPLFYRGLAHQHSGPLVLEFLPALFAGDPRFGQPPQEAVLACGVEPVREWLAPQLASAPIEVAIVGDLDVEATIAAAARTFGTLPPRRAPRRLEERRAVPAPRAGLRQAHAIDTEVPKSLVMIVFPTDDGIDPKRRRTLEVLDSVIDDRLRVEVREALGASYAPGSAAQASRVYPGVGMQMLQAMSDPGKVETLVEACLDVTGALASDGVTPEEIERLRAPLSKARRDAKRTNGYWLGVLSQAQGREEHLDEVRSADAFYASYTAEDVTPYAREYLGRERASIVIVNPSEGSGE